MFIYQTTKQKKYYDAVMRLHQETGKGAHIIAKVFPLGEKTIERWIRNFEAENGTVKPPKPMKKPRTTVSTQEPHPAQLAAQAPESTAGQIQASDVNALKMRVKELEKELLKAQIKAEAYDEMINVAEAKFNIPIRKKAGARQ